MNQYCVDNKLIITNGKGKELTLKDEEARYLLNCGYTENKE